MTRLRRVLSTGTILGILFLIASCSKLGLPLQVSHKDTSHEIVSNSLALTEKWQFQSEDRIAFPPTTSDGIVFVKTTQSPIALDTSSQSKLVALNAETGEKLWESAFSGLFKDIGPIVSKGVVVVPVNAQRALRGIDKETGEKIWELSGRDTSDYVHGLTMSDKFIFAASGIDPIRVFALDPETGKLIWEKSGEYPSRSLVDVIYQNGKLYVLFTTDIYVLNADTGETLQKLRVGAPSYDRPTYDMDSLFMNPQKGIWSINLSNGVLNWAFTPECILLQDEGPTRQGRYFLYAPTPSTENVYVTGGCRKVFGLDKQTGMVKWEYDNKNEGTISRMAILDDIGYIMFTDGTILGLDLETGTEVGRLTTSSAKGQWEVNRQGVAASLSKLFFTFGDNTLFAFGK